MASRALAWCVRVGAGAAAAAERVVVEGSDAEMAMGVVAGALFAKAGSSKSRSSSESRSRWPIKEKPGVKYRLVNTHQARDQKGSPCSSRGANRSLRFVVDGRWTGSGSGSAFCDVAVEFCAC